MEATIHQDLTPYQVEKAGPGPFVTRRRFRLPDGSEHHWKSRLHRKHLVETELQEFWQQERAVSRCLWMPAKLNWWIGCIFALGASFFLLGSCLSLLPSVAQDLRLTTAQVNATFFIGSIPFTIAAYLQLYQAANAGVFTGEGHRRFRRRYWFGWRPSDLGWWSCALQFIGTVLFNVNTYDAMLPSLNWWRQDLLVWIANVLGSVLFLASGYLAFIENAHSYWKWQWRSLSWWVVFTNLFGCVAFMLSAGFAWTLPQNPPIDLTTIALFFTGWGAVGFLVGSLLMLPETVADES